MTNKGTTQAKPAKRPAPQAGKQTTELHEHPILIQMGKDPIAELSHVAGLARGIMLAIMQNQRVDNFVYGDPLALGDRQGFPSVGAFLADRCFRLASDFHKGLNTIIEPRVKEIIDELMAKLPPAQEEVPARPAGTGTGGSAATTAAAEDPKKEPTPPAPLGAGKETAPPAPPAPTAPAGEAGTVTGASEPDPLEEAADVDAPAGTAGKSEGGAAKAPTTIQ